MEGKKRELRYYVTVNGKVVVKEWLASLDDAPTRARIRIRLDRVEDGNFGDHRPVGEGVWELKLDFGPGWRIYYGLDGDIVVVLLCGGEKGSQNRDITTAKDYWREYREGGRKG